MFSLCPNLINSFFYEADFNVGVDTHLRDTQSGVLL